MVSFSDKFDRNDSTGLGTPLTYGWTTKHAGTYGVEIRDRVVTNEAAKNSVSIQYLSAPSKSSQVVRARFAITAEGADHRISLGTYANGTPLAASDADLFWGYGVTILFAASGVRTLGIYRNSYTVPLGLGAQQVMTTTNAASLTLKDEPTGTTDLSIVQELRFRINQDVYGVRIQAYLNNNDDDAPNLEWKESRDMLAGTNYYYWMFAFGSANLRTLYLFNIEAEDYDYKEFRTVRRDGLRLSEIIDRAKLRYEGSSSETDFDTALAKQFANDTQDDIINRLGDLAIFARPRETLTLTIDGNGYCTLPNYIERPIRITTTDNKLVSWKTVNYTTDGSMVVCIGESQTGYAAPSGSYYVDYELKWTRMNKNEDTSIIPRRFQEALVMGVVYRMSGFDTSSKAYSLYKMEYEEKLLNIKRIMNNLRRSEHNRLRSPRPVNSNNFFNDIEWNRTV